MTADLPLEAAAEATSESPEEGRPGIRPSGRRLLLLSSVGAAISNLGIILLVAQVLDVEDNKEFLVFWALLFGLFGVQSGIQNETTRATTRPSPAGARILSGALLWGAVFALVIGATSPLWASHMLPRSAGSAILVLVITSFLYPIYVTMLGALGGRGHWEWFGSTLLVEVGVRVALVFLAAGIGASLGGFEAASAAAVLTLGAILLIGRVPRRALLSRADVPLPRLLRHQALAMLSTACTAVLINGYPALVSVTNPQGSLGLPPEQSAALMGACMLAVSFTRAPIMMPLTVFVGVAISAFVGHRGSIWSAVRKPFLLLLAVGLFGGAAAWPIGPWFMRLVKPEYDLPGWYFAALTTSSVLMAWLMILGAIALATNRHLLYVIGWGTASAVGAMCLLLPLHLTVTTTLSVSVGPAAGILILFAALQRRQRLHEHADLASAS